MLKALPIQLSDDSVAAIEDGKNILQALRDYRAERGYGDGGWGEYLATKLERWFAEGIGLDEETSHAHDRLVELIHEEATNRAGQ